MHPPTEWWLITPRGGWCNPPPHLIGFKVYQESCMYSWTLPLYVNGEAFKKASKVWMHLGTINYRWLKCRLACKVIHPNYSKQWPYLLPSTMDCDCSKIWNHGLNHGLFLSLFKLFLCKYVLNWIRNSGLKSRVLYCLSFWFLFLDVQANLSEASSFLSALMAVLSSSSLVFMLLGCITLLAWFNWIMVSFVGGRLPPYPCKDAKPMSLVSHVKKQLFDARLCI